MKSKKRLFEEEYLIKFTYQKSDGYWVHNQEEIVLVPLIDGMEEKSNHDLAKQIILKKYPKCVINKVYYC